jgi:hypothetical protein
VTDPTLMLIEFTPDSARDSTTDRVIIVTY